MVWEEGAREHIDFFLDVAARIFGSNSQFVTLEDQMHQFSTVHSFPR